MIELKDVWVRYQDDEAMALVRERKATPADLLAVVRRGVESGEIEGEVLPQATIRDKRGKYRNGDFIVIPVDVEET